MQTRTWEKSGREPILVSIRPTLRCNFDCSMCLSSSNFQRRESADWNQLEKFFEQLDRAGFRGDLHICGGEPFVYGEIDRLIVESSRHAHALSVLTNASWVPTELNDANSGRLLERLSIVRNLPNTTLRLSVDTYHFKGSRGGETKGLQRLRVFVEAARMVGLIPNRHYQVMITEATLEDALRMKDRLAELLEITETDFIKARGVYKLGRSKEGKEFRLGEPGYIAINPTTEGTLIIYAGRQEETAQVVYGNVDRLQEVIEHHRKLLADRME